MKTETDLLLEEAASRTGKNVHDFLREKLAELACVAPEMPITAAIQDIANEEYAQQQKDTAQCV